MPHGPHPAWASNVSQVKDLNPVAISPESGIKMNSSHPFETAALLVERGYLGLADRPTCSLLYALLA
jgi:hypothetical protein